MGTDWDIFALIFHYGWSRDGVFAALFYAFCRWLLSLNIGCLVAEILTWVNSRINHDVNKKNALQLEAARPKRKYTKRKDREAAAAAEGVMLGPDGKKLPKAARALSPLTHVR